MIAVILAAGMAKRLRPLTDACPKCLLKVGGRTLLERIVDAVVSCGIHDFVVVTGYRASMISDFLKEHYREETFHFIHNADYATTNNIYSLWLTRSYADRNDFILLDSDILFDSALISRLMNETDTVLAVNRHELGEEEMKVIVDEHHRVTHISKTCDISQAMGESVGIEVIRADYSEKLFEEMEHMMNVEHLTDTFYEQSFERLILKGFSFHAIDTTDLFSMELDTVEDFEQACNKIPENLL
ncbi:MAG: phosphocholine cytidylyltransferase family protein [Phocaeicola sp.]|uniref:phosphocholine cytidylyltransferase family protein n=1 Tax=Phocaeicola TaxID=909656 RepID=UPI00234F3141|nr:phosphocholine cytidylyltransferase family protein [Phocaeicola oris]MCE2616944.1 phosphocholine cytidylyltransferase family protein [Phocaeicola oris]